jgi:hypothetical protein
MMSKGRVSIPLQELKRRAHELRPLLVRGPAVTEIAVMQALEEYRGCCSCGRKKQRSHTLCGACYQVKRVRKQRPADAAEISYHHGTAVVEPKKAQECQTCHAACTKGYRWCKPCTRAFKAAKMAAKMSQAEYSRPLPKVRTEVVFQAVDVPGGESREVYSCRCGIRYIGPTCPKCASPSTHK